MAGAQRVLDGQRMRLKRSWKCPKLRLVGFKQAYPEELALAQLQAVRLVEKDLPRAVRRHRRKRRRVAKLTIQVLCSISPTLPLARFRESNPLPSQPSSQWDPAAGSVDKWAQFGRRYLCLYRLLEFQVKLWQIGALYFFHWERNVLSIRSFI